MRGRSKGSSFLLYQGGGGAGEEREERAVNADDGERGESGEKEMIGQALAIYLEVLV